MENAFAEKTKGLEMLHTKDLKNQKETWMASEKLKRDKWIQEKTKIIKDQTIKSLEPEIQRMLSVNLRVTKG